MIFENEESVKDFYSGVRIFYSFCVFDGGILWILF